MVGLVQKLLLDLVEEVGGPGTAADVKRRAGVPFDRVFHMQEVYDDAEFQRLFAAACEVLNLTQEQAEKVYADYFLRDGLKRWPTWFEMSSNARQFLERQPAIHNNFATGVQDPTAREAIIDKFRLEKLDAELIMHYRSPNHLCGLYMALARWIIEHYGDRATVRESACVSNGDAECQIHIHWEPGAKQDRRS